MKLQFPKSRHWLVVLIWIAALGVGGTCGAISPPVDEQEEPEEANAAEAPQPQFGPEVLDSWLFRNRSATVVRSELDSQLSMRIEDLAGVCGATDVEKKKLQLAGRGDIKRFFDDAEKIRDKFRGTKQDQEAINAVFQEIQPLQMKLNSGLFGSSSLFAKTLRRTLTGDRAAAYDKVMQERLTFRYRAKVELVVGMLDSSLALRAEQRRRLIGLLLAETRPPRAFGQYDYYYVMVQAVRLPETKLKPIFDDAQWKILSRHLDQMRQIEPFLKQSGYMLDENEPAPAKPVAAAPATPDS